VDYDQDAQNYSGFGRVNPKKKEMEFVIVGVIIATIIMFIRFIIKKVFDSKMPPFFNDGILGFQNILIEFFNSGNTSQIFHTPRLLQSQSQ